MPNLLWEPKGFIHFDDTEYSIDLTCERRKLEFLPYVRKYKNLSHAELLELIQDAQANHWQALDLSNSGLEDIPDELWSLTDLQLLYLGNASLHFDDSLKGAPNTISHLPRSIEKLKKLRVLSLYGLTVSIKGDYPLDLNRLVHLELFDSNYETFPEAFAIPSITGLAIDGLHDFPTAIFKLHNLTDLYLPRCGFSSLPDEIHCLSRLKVLSLAGNGIEVLPTSILNLTQLEDLLIYGTPLADLIPKEIGRQSAQEIIRYVLKMQDDTPKAFFNESKMIIVGQPQVGKSSLMERLVYSRYSDKESTEGINIAPWVFLHDGEEYRLNLWDFGGQEIYHATHQFFLTQRSLYILVWDALSEDEYGRIDYWLRTIQSFADDSPIFIVVNKCDPNNGRRKKLNLEEYKKRYPQIVDICEVSCRYDLGIDELREKIKQVAVNLPLMKTPWLTAWLNVRKLLETQAKEKNHIKYSSYLNMCHNQGVSEEDALSLAKYLHDLGVILYYEDDLLLRNMVILSSEWGTDAVYKILDEQERHLKGRNGILLPNNDLDSIWTDQERYPREYHQHLLNLMVNFRLSFRIDDYQYLVAELLEDRPITLPLTFEFGETLSFRYNYDFLPAGIMTRFIVSAHEKLEVIGGIRQCWKKGAYLRHGAAYALVRLFDTPPDRYVIIQVSGTDARQKQELLTYIRIKLEKLHSIFSKINITRQIPCNCKANCTSLFPYEMLLRAEAGGRTTVMCYESLRDIGVRKLLDGVEVIMEYPADRQPIYQTNFYNNNSPSNMYTASNQNVSSNNSENTNENTTEISIEISVEVKDAIDEFYAGFNDLRTEVEDSEFEALCKKVDKALELLDKSSSEEAMKRTGSMNKLERFLMECHDPESDTGKLLAGVKYAGNIVLKLGKSYNKLAGLLGAPSIPLIGT